jgi:large subunit ribosomal protein L5
MAIPTLTKIIVSMCIGKSTEKGDLLTVASKDLQSITGQKPLQTRARKSVASFKIRVGQAIGLKVTLRRKRMYEFMDRLISIAIPRIRDFRGLSYSNFDSSGNYTLGLTEQSVFPEIDVSKVENVTGMNITFCTKATRKEHAVELLKALGMPFRHG